MNSRRFILCLCILSGAAPGSSATIRVPADEATIQDGIRGAADGDTVLVAPGRYFETVNFSGKNIVVASHYIINSDPSIVDSTIIDASRPQNPDTASCVLIVSRETREAVLTGFTLTGGKGTRWTDEHGYGDYYEGGGILITRSSPTISHNIIINNQAIRKNEETVSAGGGGIRCGDGAPLIEHNIICGNSGMYGGGIVMNFASGEIRHNVIYNNRVFQAAEDANTFGGGGIWVYGAGSVVIIENNTIVGNSSAGERGQHVGQGGGILVWATPAAIRHNILWDNVQQKYGPVRVRETEAVIEYNNIQGGGNENDQGNIDHDPLFCDPANGLFTLAENSPCLSAGRGGENMGALGSGCGEKFVIKKAGVDVEYGEDGLDQVLFSADITNPGGNPLSTHAVIRAYNETVADSIELRDDGTGGDAAAGDGLWSGLWENVNRESIYVTRIRAREPAAGVTYISYDSTVFSTTGPVAAVDYALPYAERPPQAGDDVYFQLVLENLGDSADVTDLFVEAAALPEDPRVDTFWSQPMTYGNIPPDSSSTSPSTYWLRISEDCPGGEQIPLAIDIASEGHFFWQDTLLIEVHYPQSALDLDRPARLTFALHHNHPNPFNPETTIEYVIPEQGYLEMHILDTLGRRIRTLIAGETPRGRHRITWNGLDDRGRPAASGVYLCTMKTAVFSGMKKLLLIR